MKIISDNILLLIHKLAAMEELAHKDKSNADQLLAGGVT